MPETESLPVELNRRRLHDVDTPESFTTNGDFSVVLGNHGEAVHVHLHLDDDLSAVARLEAGNHYVEGEATQSVRVHVDPVDSPVTGKLKIVTGYGATTQYVSVTVEPVTEQKSSVAVDETLSKPPQREPEPDPLLVRTADALPGRRVLPVIFLALVAVAIAGGVAVSIDSTAVTLGAGVVIGGVVAAIYFVLR